MAEASQIAIANEFSALQWEELRKIRPAVKVFTEKDESLLRIRADEEIRICVLRRTGLYIGGAVAYVY